MSRIKWIVVAGLAGLLAWAGWRGWEAAGVAVGYTAKQLCSGVFVAGLPAAFVIERDVYPRMAILGPARSLLDLTVDAERGEARSRFLLASAVAGVQSPDTGCSLHRRGRGDLAARPEVAARSLRALPALPGALLDAAFAEPPGGGRDTLAIVASRGGAVVAERYRDPVDATTRLQGWSMNKSLLATWVALRAAQTQKLQLDLPVRPRLEALGAPAAVVSGLSPALTLGHLLQMESGLAFEERYEPGSDATAMLYRREAMWQVAPATGQARPPGSSFSYSSGDSNLAAYLWQQSLPAPEAYATWIERHFSEPLGIRSLVPEADASGVQVGSSYSYMTARDWLRVGQLWLDAWHGRSPLLSRDWMREATAPRPSDPRGRYGRGFWLNTGGVAFPGAPENLFYAGGNAGQYVIVVPEAELVLVRLGLSDERAERGVAALLRAALAAGASGG
jgi:CubicO group peptidase (beta-lactamase class C family)